MCAAANLRRGVKGEERLARGAALPDGQKELGEVVEALGVATRRPHGLHAHVLAQVEEHDGGPQVATLERRVYDLGAGAALDDGQDLAEVATEDDDLATEGDVGQPRVHLLAHDVAEGAVEGLDAPPVQHDGLVDEEERRADEELGLVALHVHVEDGVVSNGDGALGAGVEGDAEGEEESRNPGGRRGDGDFTLGADRLEDEVVEERLPAPTGAVEEEDVVVVGGAASQRVDRVGHAVVVDGIHHAGESRALEVVDLGPRRLPRSRRLRPQTDLLRQRLAVEPELGTDEDVVVEVAGVGPCGGKLELIEGEARVEVAEPLLREKGGGWLDTMEEG